MGGHLARYTPEEQARLQLDIRGNRPLLELLAELNVPAAEVALTVVNGTLVDLAWQSVTTHDQVQLFPPLGGG